MRIELCWESRCVPDQEQHCRRRRAADAFLPPVEDGSPAQDIPYASAGEVLRRHGCDAGSPEMQDHQPLPDLHKGRHPIYADGSERARRSSRFPRYVATTRSRRRKFTSSVTLSRRLPPTVERWKGPQRPPDTRRVLESRSSNFRKA